MREKLTGLNDPITVEGQETTILAEFQNPQSDKPVLTPLGNIRLDVRPPDPDFYDVTLFSDDGPRAHFRISPADADYLREQKLWSGMDGIHER